MELHDDGRRVEESPTIAENERTRLSEEMPSRPPSRARIAEVVLFFLSGVGATVGWTAVLSNLVFYTETLGTASYLYLNTAVYFPMLPITVAQARWDSYFDRQYRSLFTFSFRCYFGFSVSFVTVTLMPLVSHDLTALVVLTFLLGTASGVLHGTLKQMASFVYPNGKSLPAAVTSGMQASAAMVLIVSLSTGFGSSGDSKGLVVFYGSIAAIVVVCWVAFKILISHSQDVLESMLRRDSSIGSLEEPLVTRDEDEMFFETNDEIARSSTDIELSYAKLWTKTWPSCAALMITVASSMSVSSWFNQISSSDPNYMSLPQILFYTRLFADLLGRPATLLIKPTSLSCVGVVALLRLLFVPIFFLYASPVWERILPKSDAAIIIGVAAFAFSSGYIATACYQLAPDLLTEDQSSSAPKQASLINVCFSGSILVGLGVSFALLGAGL